MKVVAPHMGTIGTLLTDLFGRLDVDFMTPPPTTQKTLKIGLQHGPEFACLPLKLTLANLIEGLEAGADTTVMVGGCGPCRFGYYADIQRRIIESLGYDFTSIIIEPPTQDWSKFKATIREVLPDTPWLKLGNAIRLSFRKAQAFDRIDKRAIETRCFETERGATDKVREQAQKIVFAARSGRDIADAEAEALALFDRMPKRDVEPLKIMLVGEFFLLLEPFINFDIENYLGERGVFLQRSVYLTDWIGPSKKNPVAGHSDAYVAQMAAPYLDYRVGGEGQATIGHTMIAKHEGYDGVIQMLPFTCMPDTIAKAILPAISKNEDIPVLTLIVDEQTGKAGVHTRLEAFLDLLVSRRHSRRAASA